MTPYQAKVAMEGGRENMTIRSWYVAALSRQRKLPALETLLSNKPKKSPEDLKDALRGFGGRRGKK
jgi:hypothetical protein